MILIKTTHHNNLNTIAMLELLQFPSDACALRLFNTCDYTWPQLIVNIVGCFLWLVAYYSVIRNFLKTRFIEIPLYVACANIAWEFVWSFIFYPNLGLLYWIGYAIAFFMDVYIFAMAIKYGRKDVVDEGIKKRFPLFMILNALTWGVLLFYFRSVELDDNFGATSGFIINFLLSTLFLMLVLRIKDASVLTLLTAGSKGLGTGIITISMFMIYPENGFIHALGVFCFILDLAYFVILFNRKKALRVATG